MKSPQKIQDMKSRDYHAATASPTNLGGAVSKSMLWAFNQSPFKWRFGKRSTPSPAMQLGSLVHLLCFQKDEFDETYAVSPFDSFRTKESKEWREDMESQGKVVITEDTHTHAAEIADCIMNTDLLFHLGECEYEVAVRSDFHGIPVQGMIDMAPKHGQILADLKTTSSITDVASLQRIILNRGYHWQAAMYLDLWNGVTGESRDQFQFLFIEVENPYEYAWVEISPNLLAKGREEYMNALMRWIDCSSKNKWPKSIEGMQTIDLPAWYQ